MPASFKAPSAIGCPLPWLSVRVPREESALQNPNCTSIRFHYFGRLLTRKDIFVCESRKRNGVFGGSLNYASPLFGVIILNPKIGANWSRLHACFTQDALCNRLPWLSVRVPRQESALHNPNGTSIGFHYFSRLFTRADMFVRESHKRSRAFGGWLLEAGTVGHFTEEEKDR
ncbi:hypothetical protein CEXT_563491 [Caerostris extrusa]|uniref:Uncharacterized protein n=1 Tax=Caerostris extrusa TaxID=172846 RepID=A0AAV4MY56_CAEEX|nr:hypothetical protein CEXT_563491 [Caerostris extrusa]